MEGGQPEAKQDKDNDKEKEAPPSDNLYVAGMPPNATEEYVRSLFGSGVSQCRVLPSRGPDEIQSVALVRFNDAQEAMNVRQSMDGCSLPGMDLPMRIRYCGKPAGTGGAWKGGQYGKVTTTGGGTQRVTPYNSTQPNENLYITGLPHGIDTQWLEQMFGQYGTVKDCKVLQPKSDRPTRHALVRYTTVDEAVSVKQGLNGSTVPGSDEPMTVEYAKNGSKEQLMEKSQQAQQILANLQMQQANLGGWWSSPGGKWGAPVSPGCKGKGKGGAGKGPPGMDDVLMGFDASKCLPGSELGQDDNCLYLHGLPPDCEDLHLYRLCSAFGGIALKGVAAMKGPDGYCRGIGFVNFLEPDAVRAAAAVLNGCVMPDGTVLKALPKRKTPGWKGGEGKGDAASTGQQDGFGDVDDGSQALYELLGEKPPSSSGAGQKGGWSEHQGGGDWWASYGKGW